MTTLANQTERIQWLLQDTDTSPTNLAKITTQYQESMTRLSRKHVFTNILWVQALANVSRYLLPPNTAKIAYVFYNERVLHYVTEHSLDRTRKNWEALHRDPDYWTYDNQAPNTIRLVPTPLRTGSDIPVIPSPLIMPMLDNLVIFLDENPAADVAAPESVLPNQLDWDDVLVMDCVQALASQETPTQNLPLAQVVGQLGEMWLQLLEKK